MFCVELVAIENAARGPVVFVLLFFPQGCKANRFKISFASCTAVHILYCFSFLSHFFFFFSSSLYPVSSKDYLVK